MNLIIIGYAQPLNSVKIEILKSPRLALSLRKFKKAFSEIG
jgi:hypothetical protein